VRITAAVRALRDVPNEEKVLRLKALADTSCTVAELCALRATCLDGYGRHVSARESLAAARRLLDGNPDASAALIARAERELAAAREQVKLCALAEAEVRSKYRM
jgi:hypothetical protein